MNEIENKIQEFIEIHKKQAEHYKKDQFHLMDYDIYNLKILIKNACKEEHDKNMANILDNLKFMKNEHGENVMEKRFAFITEIEAEIKKITI